MPRHQNVNAQKVVVGCLACGAAIAAIIGYFVPNLIWWGYAAITFIVAVLAYPPWLEMAAHEAIIKGDNAASQTEKPTPKWLGLALLGLVIVVVGVPFIHHQLVLNAGFSSEAEQREARAQGFTTGQQWQTKLALDKSQADQETLEKAVDVKIAQAKAMIATLKAEQLSKNEQARREAACPTDPECQFKKQLPDLEAICEHLLKYSAKYDFRWNTGWFGQPWNAFGWTDATKTEMFVSGNKIEMKNGYGAWIPQNYSCTYNLAKKTITGLEVSPRRN